MAKTQSSKAMERYMHKLICMHALYCFVHVLYIHTYMSACLSACLPACLSVCMYVCMYVCMCVASLAINVICTCTCK